METLDIVSTDNSLTTSGYKISTTLLFSVADPGFPVGGGVDLVGGHQLPRQLRFENFVCRNKRIWTLRGACAGHVLLDPPMLAVVK